MTGDPRLTPARLDEVPEGMRALPPAVLRRALDQGRCGGAHNDDWYPRGEAATSAARAYARAQCGGCVVRLECLELALRTRESYGIWGGLIPPDRERIQDRRRKIPGSAGSRPATLARSA